MLRVGSMEIDWGKVDAFYRREGTIYYGYNKKETQELVTYSDDERAAYVFRRIQENADEAIIDVKTFEDEWYKNKKRRLLNEYPQLVAAVPVKFWDGVFQAGSNSLVHSKSSGDLRRSDPTPPPPTPLFNVEEGSDYQPDSTPTTPPEPEGSDSQ